MAKKSKKTKNLEQEVIGPDGRSQASFGFGAWMDQLKGGSLADTFYLVVGAIAIVIGLIMLADIAIGLLLILLGTTGVNNWLMKNKK